jgi:hypothetical protein
MGSRRGFGITLAVRSSHLAAKSGANYYRIGGVMQNDPGKPAMAGAAQYSGL